MHFLKWKYFNLEFHWSLFPRVQVLVRIMAWCRPGDKPLSEPMMITLLMQICATQPQWDNANQKTNNDDKYATPCLRSLLIGIIIDLDLQGQTLFKTQFLPNSEITLVPKKYINIRFVHHSNSLQLSFETGVISVFNVAPVIPAGRMMNGGYWSCYTPQCDWGLLKPFIFAVKIFLLLRKCLLEPFNHIHIWQVSPQLCLGDICIDRAVVTSTSYERDIYKIYSVLIIIPIRENQRTGRLVSYPHPGMMKLTNIILLLITWQYSLLSIIFSDFALHKAEHLFEWTDGSLR